MSEKMMDEFKGWAYKSGYDIDDAQESADDEKFFVCYDTEACWQAWQASRAALVVELPSDINGEYYADGWNAALMCVEGMLEEAGVSYK